MDNKAKAQVSRTTALRLFSRDKNSFITIVEEEDVDLHLVINRFVKIEKLFANVVVAHEQYVQEIQATSDAEKLAKEEKWMKNIEIEYENIEKVRYSLERKSRDEYIKIEVQKNSGEVVTQPKHDETFELKKALRLLQIEDKIFEGLAKSIEDMIKPRVEERILANLKEIKEQFKGSFEKYKQAQSNYIIILSDDEVVTKAMDSIEKAQQKYLSLSNELEKRILLKRSAQEQGGVKMKGGIAMERMKLPVFQGNLREYARFKSDFINHVLPELKEQSRAYVLKSCLKDEAYEYVQNVDDDYKAMLKRLDEKYGCASKLVDLVMKDIKNMKSIKEADYKGFIEMVNVVDKGYRDLARLKVDRELSNSTAVSIIEERMPLNIKIKWAEKVKKSTSTIEDTNKFPALMAFLLEQKRILEYLLDDLRVGKDVKDEEEEGNVNLVTENKNWKCPVHNRDDHLLENCRSYLAQSPQEKVYAVRESRACWSCLRTGHTSSNCRFKKVCGIDSCAKYHHTSLHEAHVSGLTFHYRVGHTRNMEGSLSSCLLQIMRVKTGCINPDSVNVLWDGGATISLITFKCAKRLGLIGKPIKLSILKVGGTEESINSFKYILPIVDMNGKTVHIQVYGIDCISSDVKEINLSEVSKLFHDVKLSSFRRPSGKIDVLIGFEYAGYHPIRKASAGNLLLLTNEFGSCIGGSHPLLKESTEKIVKVATVCHVAKISVKDFFDAENTGISSLPKCVKCGEHPLGGKNYTIQEELELRQIDEGLKYKGNYWESSYPWVKDPNNLPDNRMMALQTLKSTERRLRKDEEHKKLYQAQMDDMFERGVARKLTNEEMKMYNGPFYYVSHHVVMNPKSKSTQCRLVFHTSQDFKGHQLNEYWAKGPDLINNLLGIVIRFRERTVVLMGDIKKMYHSVKICQLDQHTHRFLWRDMEERSPDTYVMTSVSFGDKPAGAIATRALHKTAEMKKNELPEAAKVVLTDSYVDDIITSTQTVEQAKKLSVEIDQILELGGFKIKRWIIGRKVVEKNMEDKEEMCEKVLGLQWDVINDTISFKIQLNFSKKKRGAYVEKDVEKNELLHRIPQILTKRVVLAQVNKIYDPLGLVTPVTVRAKFLMRKLWMNEHNQLLWDDPIPEMIKEEWVQLFEDLYKLEEIIFERCILPDKAVGEPILVLFSDGSEKAFGSCAYARWEMADGSFCSKLIASKSRLTPIKTLSIVRIELNGALLAKRLSEFIKAESTFKFANTMFIIDSQIVRAMINKQSYGFGTYVAVRVGEIQESTNPESWYWIEGKSNVADIITRGTDLTEPLVRKTWQNGPEFLQLPVSEWPIKQEMLSNIPLEEMKRGKVMTVTKRDELAERIDIKRFSTFQKLVRVTARVLSMYQHIPTLSFKNAALPVNGEMFERGELFWVKEAQLDLKPEFDSGGFRRLCPEVREDGIIVVGGRMEKVLADNYGNRKPILLPYKHKFSELYAEFIHNKGHLGISATVCKIREKYWVTKLYIIVRRIRSRCVMCKLLDERCEKQIMSPLPLERLKPAPVWSTTSMDMFGPFQIRGQVNKRARGKGYGVIFTCLLTRAVYLDLADDYGTQGFLLVLRRFCTIRGFPRQLISDQGTQLIAASKELKTAIRLLNNDKLQEFGAEKGINWKFTPPDGPWFNGCAEALVKSIKRSIQAAIGEQILLFSELQTVLFEVANLINERPIGRHPTDVSEGSYLCPNDLILGRCDGRIPSGPFKQHCSPTHRFRFVQSIVNSFWLKWTRHYFHSLIIRQKWHHEKRNMKSGDIVMIQDSNAIRGNWRLGRVKDVLPSNDGKVRRVKVEYKSNFDSAKYTVLERPVHRLIVLVPVDDE